MTTLAKIASFVNNVEKLLLILLVIAVVLYTIVFIYETIKKSLKKNDELLDLIHISIDLLLYCIYDDLIKDLPLRKRLTFHALGYSLLSITKPHIPECGEDMKGKLLVISRYFEKNKDKLCFELDENKEDCKNV